MEAPIAGDPSPVLAQAPLTGAVLGRGVVRLQAPPVTPGPRRVAIQAGHWKTDQAPDELRALRLQLGAVVGGFREVTMNVDMAERVARLLRAEGIVVDVLPTTIPPSYVADAFVALHADDDRERTHRGFKIAHGFYRGPHEEALVEALAEEYAQATALPWSDEITDNMTDYYAFAWFRYEHALAPHTPAAIFELGYLSDETDRTFLLSEQNTIAAAIARGVERFLDAHPRELLFAKEIVVPTVAPPPP